MFWVEFGFALAAIISFALSVLFLRLAQNASPINKATTAVNTKDHDKWAFLYGWATFFQGMALGFAACAIVVIVTT